MFKKGDRVQRRELAGEHGGVKPGDVETVNYQVGDCVYLMGRLAIFSASSFKLAPTHENKRPHYDLIIAWANGAEIEYQDPDTKVWARTLQPKWLPNRAYRIKPEPKPDVLAYYTVVGPKDVEPASVGKGDMKIVFDGTTGMPKSVELLK